ncbi:hypothetical protein Nepgr_013316 [Nepenthes gracilis]|uniref:Uncharacterized protein n=1 Tax=Nepenthes gracilis TaxID=150966 RepID=A0AAD3XP98_NEPGR|nr:hypothetical protein Nepgr_013316 [Nepenthes gracilis]
MQKAERAASACCTILEPFQTNERPTGTHATCMSLPSSFDRGILTRCDSHLTSHAQSHRGIQGSLPFYPVTSAASNRSERVCTT